MKKKVLLAAIFFIIQCFGYCTCQQVIVSFDTLFPRSPYKQVLQAYINVWSQLRSTDLSPCQRAMLENIILGDLVRMNTRIIMRKALGHKDVYLLALLMRICEDQKLLKTVRAESVEACERIWDARFLRQAQDERGNFSSF